MRLLIMSPVEIPTFSSSFWLGVSWEVEIGHWASDFTSNVSKIYWIKSDGGHASPFHIHTTFGCVFDPSNAGLERSSLKDCLPNRQLWKIEHIALLHSFATLPSSCPEFMYQDNPQHRLASESIASEFRLSKAIFAWELIGRIGKLILAQRPEAKGKPSQ